MRTYTEDDMVQALQTVVAGAGLRKVADSTGTSVSFVSAVATGKKPISPKLLGYLGFERIPSETRFRRASK